MRAFAAFPAARLKGKRDLALFFKRNVTQTKSLSGLGLAMLVEKLPPLSSGAQRILLVGAVSLASRGAGGAELLQLRTQPLQLS